MWLQRKIYSYEPLSDGQIRLLQIFSIDGELVSDCIRVRSQSLGHSLPSHMLGACQPEAKA